MRRWAIQGTDLATAFLFINKRRDTLLLYWRDETGGRTMMKQMESEAILLPAPDAE